MHNSSRFRIKLIGHDTEWARQFRSSRSLFLIARNRTWSSRAFPSECHLPSELTCFCSPTVAIMQWRNEIEVHTEGLKVLVWHGSSRESNITELKKYDVVCHTVHLVV